MGVQIGSPVMALQLPNRHVANTYISPTIIMRSLGQTPPVANLQLHGICNKLYTSAKIQPITTPHPPQKRAGKRSHANHRQNQFL